MAGIKPRLKEHTCCNHIYLAAHIALRHAAFTQTALRFLRAETLIGELHRQTGGLSDACRDTADTAGLRPLLALKRIRQA